MAEDATKVDLTDLWLEEFVSNGHCGLCANHGFITTNVRTRAGVPCRLTNAYCICPNGRALKAKAEK